MQEGLAAARALYSWGNACCYSVDEPDCGLKGAGQHCCRPLLLFYSFQRKQEYFLSLLSHKEKDNHTEILKRAKSRYKEKET